MKRNLNKAFTLIELLAVIVILAIIALIATPIILGIVEDARKDSFERSVELVISTTDLDVASKNIQDGYTYEITDGTIPELEIGIKNIEGMNGTIVYDKEGKEQYAIHNGQYCVMKTEGMSKAEISDYEEGGCKLSITTSSKYFTYKEIIEPTYEIIDKDACQAVFVGEGNTSEDATTICNNEPSETFDGMTLTEALANGLVGPYTKILLEAGAISYTGPEYEIIDKEACIDVHMNEWNYSEEEAITSCNNEPMEKVVGMTLTEFLKFAPAFITSESISNLLEAGAIKVNAPLEITGYSEEGPKNVVIPSTIDGNTVVSIGSSAFYNKSLTSVSIPETVTSVGTYAFANNNLNEQDINKLEQKYQFSTITPTNVSCFTYEEVEGGISITGYKCADTDVIIPSTINNKTVVKIGEFAFQSYQYQSEVSYLNQAVIRPVNYEFVSAAQGTITSVILPDTITSIGKGAFSNNQITNVYLSKKLERIELLAFAYNQITTIELSNINHLTFVDNAVFCSNLVSETSEAYQIIYQLNMNAFTCQ